MTDATNDEARVAEIRGRVEAATEGPWVQGNSMNGTSPECVRIPLSEWSQASAYTGHEPTASFIAHARTDVPWLLDQRDRYKAAVDAVLGLHRPVKKGDDEWEPDTMVGRTVYCLQCSSGECGWPVRLDECPERMAVTEALGGDQ